MENILSLINEYLQKQKPKYLIPSKSNSSPQILYSGPYWSEEEILSAVESLLSGKWLVAGEKVNKFEIEFSKKFGVAYSHMVNSGSSANLVMISALKKYFKWSDGDEIIVSPVGFPTTIAPIVQNNLKPVFVDIEFDTLNFDINLIEEKITNRTKAIFVSPVLGNPPDLDRLSDICERYNIQMIGDNCDSLGTKWHGKNITDYYVSWSCSFYPAHHITTGEGGMVSTNNYELSRLFISFSWWGRDCYCVGSSNLLSCGTCGNRFDNWLDKYDGIIDHKYLFTNIGYNFKPLDLQGSIGLSQLKKFDEIESKRKNSKQKMVLLFRKYVSGIKTVKQLPESDVSWFGTPFICESSELKYKLVSFLEDNKIQTRNYFAGNILLHPGFSHLDNYKKYTNSNKVLDLVFFVGAAPHYDDHVFSYIEKVFDEKWKN